MQSNSIFGGDDGIIWTVVDGFVIIHGAITTRSFFI